MSTDRKRLTSAIQRIAREDPEIRALLDDFRNSGGKPSESATSGSGAEDRQICCDGSTSGSSNPGSHTRNPDEGGKDAGDDGLNPDDPANLDDMGPGSLTGVTDCETGEPVCFEGNDWVPPDGWGTPTEPPPESQWIPGTFWFAKRGTLGADGASATDAVKNLAQFVLDYYYSGNGGYNYVSTNLYPSDPNRESFDLTIIKPSGEVQENTEIASRDDCSDSSSEVYCEEGYTHTPTWPEDGCVNLAVKGGKIVGSKFDPENDGSWSKPRDSVELCDEHGNSFELKPSASGGWKSISSQNPGDGYLYDSSGKQIARISESEYSDPAV